MGIGRELSQDEKSLYETAIGQPRPIQVLEEQARSAILRHPAEPYLPFIVAVRLAQDRANDAIPWLGAALERADVYGPAHFVLARAIARRSPPQARLEYRLAMQQDPELVDVVMSEAPQQVGRYWDAMELVPEGPLGMQTLERLASALKDRLPSTRGRIDEELLRRSPASTEAALRVAGDAVQDVEPPAVAPWCEGSKMQACATEAIALAQKARSLDKRDCTGAALYARAMVAAGQIQRGLEALSQSADEIPDRIACLGQLVAIARKADAPAVAQAALEKLARAHCVSSGDCAHEFALVAQEEEAQGETRSALAIYKRAYEQAPEDDALLAQVARLAAASNLHAEALADYEKLAKRHPEDRHWAAAASREREATLKETL